MEGPSITVHSAAGESYTIPLQGGSRVYDVRWRLHFEHNVRPGPLHSGMSALPDTALVSGLLPGGGNFWFCSTHDALATPRCGGFTPTDADRTALRKAFGPRRDTDSFRPLFHDATCRVGCSPHLCAFRCFDGLLICPRLHLLKDLRSTSKFGVVRCVRSDVGCNLTATCTGACVLMLCHDACVLIQQRRYSFQTQSNPQTRYLRCLLL